LCSVLGAVTMVTVSLARLGAMRYGHGRLKLQRATVRSTGQVFTRNVTTHVGSYFV